jgi:hypothetical protein
MALELDAIEDTSLLSSSAPGVEVASPLNELDLFAGADNINRGCFDGSGRGSGVRVRFRKAGLRLAGWIID